MHPTEGMWREFLDQETDPSVRQELELHLSSCAECCSVTVEVGRQRAAVARLLTALDATGPSRSSFDLSRTPRHNSSSLLWAAGIALCVVTGASATVHFGVWQRAKEWLLGSRPAAVGPSVVHPPTIAPQSPTGISLQPRDRVEVNFDEWPASGEIEIAVRGDVGFSIIATHPVQYSVRQGSVAVENRGVDASFRIVLPEALPEASIRVGGRVVGVKRGPALTGEVERTGPATYVLSGPRAEKSSRPRPDR